MEANGAVQKTEYDALGNILCVTNALGQRTEYTYDSMNRMLTEIDATGAKTSYEYDQNGQLTKKTDAIGEEETYSYDKNGNIIGDKNVKGYIGKYFYDAMNNLIRITDGIKATSLYTYDAMGRLASRTDANGATWLYVYDSNGNLLSETDPLQNVTSYEYDKANNPVQKIQADGCIIAYSYTLAGGLAGSAYSNGESSIAYRYAKDGNITSMRDVSGESNFTYDAMGFTKSITSAKGDLVEYEYSNTGEVIALVYPDGSRINYTYDLLHRIDTVTGRNGEKLTYSYNEKNQVILAKNSNGSSTTAQYDELDRIISYTNLDKDGNVLSTFLYAYDKVGNIVKEVAKQEEETITREYTYTDRQQLASVSERSNKNEDRSWRYRYDASGNRIWQEETTEAGVRTIDYRFDEAGRLTQEVDSRYGITNYVFDERENLIEKKEPETSTTYDYTAENRLSAVREGGTLLMAAQYDGLNNKVYELNRIPASTPASEETKTTWKRVAGKTVVEKEVEESSSIVESEDESSSAGSSSSESNTVPLDPVEPKKE